MKKLLFTLRHAPYGTSIAKDAIDAILATSAYDQDLSVLFLDDGVFQLTAHQATEGIEQKSLSNILAALPIYDINQLFVCQTSLALRGISASQIDDTIKVLNHTEVAELLQQQDHLLSF